MRTSARAARTQNYDQALAMNRVTRSAGVGGSGLALAIALGSGWPNGAKPHIYEGAKPETPSPNPLKVLSHDQEYELATSSTC